MKCAFCGHRTGKEATCYTTERDYVCRECAIEFELSLQFGDEYQSYQEGKASPELIAAIEAAKREWESHFAETASQYIAPSELESLDKAWTELKIEATAGAYRIEILATAYEGIRYFWKLVNQESNSDYMGYDRLFETQGQALDDALAFLQELGN